jgi:hypothetical protein
MWEIFRTFARECDFRTISLETLFYGKMRRSVMNALCVRLHRLPLAPLLALWVTVCLQTATDQRNNFELYGMSSSTAYLKKKAIK